jgi:predicted DNA-binding protein (MmcQ/YjbR family)
MRPTDPVLQKLRTLSAALPQTSETSSWGHPNFRVGQRTFATFELIRGRPSIAFRLDEPGVGLLLRRKQFFRTPYGRGQWVSVWADVPVNWNLVANLFERSYRLVALKRVNTKHGETRRKG